jgi:hypothetical protein
MNQHMVKTIGALAVKIIDSTAQRRYFHEVRTSADHGDDLRHD